jgi:hypothetical protein
METYPEIKLTPEHEANFLAYLNKHDLAEAGTDFDFTKIMTVPKAQDSKDKPVLKSEVFIKWWTIANIWV